MKIISENRIVIDRGRNIDFVVDSNDEFKSYGVSLFNMSISRMYGEKNFLTSNNDCINYLTNLISNKNHKIINDDGVVIDYDFCWQHEIYVELLPDSVYIEKWGICTKIKIEDFLDVFKEIQSFLERWKSKDIFMRQVKNAFVFKESEEAGKLFYIKTKSEINNDQIQIMLSEDDFEIDINEYIERLNFPVHMV